VVSAEQQAAIPVEEADVAGGVPGRVQRHHVPAAQVDGAPVLEEHVGLRLADEFAQSHRGLAELGDHLRGDAAVGE